MPTQSVNRLSSPAIVDGQAGTDTDFSDNAPRSSGANASPHLTHLAAIGQNIRGRSEGDGVLAAASCSTGVPYVDLAEREAVTAIQSRELREITKAVREMIERERGVIEKEPEARSFSSVHLNAADYVRRRINQNVLGNGDVWSLSFADNLQAICVVSRSPRKKDGRTFAELESVLALPGTRGYGSAILQLAVNYAQRCGHSGRIVVEPIEDSAPFFEAMGFENIEGALYFDPAKHENKWAFCEETSVWQLSNAKQRVPVTAINLPAVIGKVRASNVKASFDRATV